MSTDSFRIARGHSERVFFPTIDITPAQGELLATYLIESGALA